jgi:hypothetical protein
MSRLVRSGHGTTPGLQGHSATSLQPERSEGQIPVAHPPCWNFQKRNWMRWESNHSSPHYKRRTRCVNHYTKHPHDQEVDYFNKGLGHSRYINLKSLEGNFACMSTGFKAFQNELPRLLGHNARPIKVLDQAKMSQTRRILCAEDAYGESLSGHNVKRRFFVNPMGPPVCMRSRNGRWERKPL